ncbi:MAG: HEAT repeat domain-containing protein [Verrucomicrobia bacterium]|nr:HEAT repeat domain-containing protein [Verrucomicrobiota bacterium]
MEGLFYNYGEFEQHLADLRSPDRETCRKAARTLGEMGPKAAPAVPALLGLLKDKTNPGGFIAGDAHAAIVSIGVPLAADIPAVAGVLKDGDPRVRQDALHLLGNLAYKHTSDDALERMVPEVIGMLASADYATQSAAINFLRWLGPHAAPASAALAALLTHTEPSLRWQAAEALGLIGPAAKHVIPALAAAMADPDPKVRAHTAAALKSLKGKETK